MKTQRSYSYSETLSDVIESRPCLKFRAEDSLPDILNRMKETGEKAVGVVDAGGHLVGLITESTLTRRLLPRLKRWPSSIDDLCKLKAIDGLIAWDVIIAQPDYLHVDDSIEDAVDLMTYLSHEYMPVTDTQKRLVGIVCVEELKNVLEKKYGAIKSLDDPISLYAIQQKLCDMNLRYSQTL